MAKMAKLSQGLSKAVDAEKRARSVVLSGIPEPYLAPPSSGKQQQLESKVIEILDQLVVNCRPVEIYRMGRPESHTHARLIKLVLPSRSHWVAALSNSNELRSSCFTFVNV